MFLLPLHTSSWSARAPRWQVTLSLLLEMIFTLSEDMTASGASARDLTNTMWSLRCGWTWQQADLPPKVCIVHGGGCFADQSLFIAWGGGEFWEGSVRRRISRRQWGREGWIIRILYCRALWGDQVKFYRYTSEILRTHRTPPPSQAFFIKES